MGKTYLKELAPWEQKSKYFKNVRSGYLEDIQQNIDMLLSGIRSQTQNRLESSKKIIVSHDIISDVIDYFSIDEAHVAQGLLGVGPAFEWGISDVLWKIEQNSSFFKQNFPGSAKKYTDQSLISLNQKAEEGYQKGWFDESLKSFLRMEKRGGADFAVYISMGMIYLLHVINKEKAFEYFQKAEDYAKSRSKFYTSFTLLYQALIKRDMGFVEEAEALSKKATAISPSFSEAYYQNAQYNALIGKADKAVHMLKKATDIDVRYLFKLSNDDVFEPIQQQLKGLFDQIQKTKKQNAAAGYDKYKVFINEIYDLKNQYNDTFRANPIEFEPDILRTIQRGMDEMEGYLSRGSIMDFFLMDALMTNSNFSRGTRQLYLKIHRNIMLRRKEFRAPFEKKIQQVRNRCNMFTGDGNHRMGQFLVTMAYFAFGTFGAIVATSVRMSIPSGIIGAIFGFLLALLIQFVIKRYGETYDIDYSVYDTYSKTDTFLSHLKNLEKNISMNETGSLGFSV